MTSTFTVEARTALSPEWDRGFDEAFTDLVTSDPDWVDNEFDALIDAGFGEPPEPPGPPAPPAGRPEPRRSSPATGRTPPAPATDPLTADTDAIQRSPP